MTRHISAEPTENRGVNPAQNLEALVAHVNQHHADAALCLFVGDLTHEGDSAEYRHFKSLIAPLNVPIGLMVGNHDHRDNFIAANLTTRIYSGDYIQFAVDIGEHHRLIALDTLNAPPYNHMRHVGRLCSDRLNFLEAQLNNAGDKQLILAIHHQPFKIGLPGMDVIRLWNDTEFLALIGRYPSVKMLLMGHNHRNISGVSHGFPFTCFKSLSPQTPLDFASLDPTGGVAEPPSYGVLLLTEDGILVHFEDYTANAPVITNWGEVDAGTKAGWQALVDARL